MKKASGRDMRMNRGKIERHRLGKTELALLTEITDSDIASTIFRAHSVGQMLYLAHKNARERALKKHEIQRALVRLQKKGLLELLEDSEGALVRITKDGTRELRFTLKSWEHVKKWDGKWRILFFDIPETNSMLREELRGLLKRIGFLHMQRSVYVYPYQVVELEKLLVEKSLPASQVAYTVVESITQEHLLKKHFKLS